MASPLKFDTSRVDELPRIVEMKIAMFQESGHANLLAPEAESIVLNDYQALYKEKTAKHFVARDNGKIIASVGAFIKSDLPYRYFHPGCYGFIGDVYTEPHYRRMGIAKRLSHNALKWLSSRGVMSVRLLASDSARPMYQKLGFSSTDEMALSLRDNNELSSNVDEAIRYIQDH